MSEQHADVEECACGENQLFLETECYMVNVGGNDRRKKEKKQKIKLGLNLDIKMLIIDKEKERKGEVEMKSNEEGKKRS